MLARGVGNQRSSARRSRREGASGVCGCGHGVAKSGGAQGGGSAVVGSSRSEKGTEGRAVGEGVVWARAYGVSRHLPASKGRGCPGEPGSVTPLPSPSIRVFIPSFGLLHPLVSLLPGRGGGVRMWGAVCMRLSVCNHDVGPLSPFSINNEGFRKKNEGFPAKKGTASGLLRQASPSPLHMPCSRAGQEAD